MRHTSANLLSEAPKIAALTRRRKHLTGTSLPEVRQIAVVGDEPEALLLAVLFSEARVSIYLAGPFEGSDNRVFSNTWDEAQWLLNLHRRNGRIVQVGDPEELPLARIPNIIVTGHANSQLGMSSLERAVRTVAKNLQKDSSLTFAGLCRPGYTLGTIGGMVEKYSGLSIDGEIGLCYLPLLWNGEDFQAFREKPVILAAATEKVASHAHGLFLQVFPAITSTPKISTAEAAGLFTPLYREVVGALELELAGFCQNERVDYAEASTLCKTLGSQAWGAPRTSPARDSVASTIAASAIGARGSRLIKVAKRVNEHAPSQVLELIKSALALCGRRIRHTKIAFLGLNGLQSVSSIKRSPPQILHTLRRRGASISLFLRETSTRSLGEYPDSISVETSLRRTVQSASCAVVALDRLSGTELDPQLLASEMTRPGAVCDISRVLEASNVERAGLFYTSIGRGHTEA